MADEGAKLATGWLELTVSTAGAQKQITESVLPGATAAGDKAGRSMGGAILGGIRSLAGPIAAAFGAISIGGFVKDAIGAASDLQQSVGAIDAIFKGSAGQMHSWAQSAARDVGLTKDQYNSLSSVLGAQLKNGGTALDQLSGKTNNLIGVAADLSAQFGGSTSQAVEALSSALKGERDPIERYGVSLRQTTIDAEAARLGFQKVGGTLSNEATQAATLSLIMKQTSDAHGAFARETDTLAHKQQVLNAMWENGKAKLGAAFLPVVSTFTGLLTSVLGPAMDGLATGAQKLFGWFGKLGSSGIGKAFAPLGEAFGQIAEAVGPLVSQFLQLAPSVSPFMIIMKALAPVLPQIAQAAAQLVGVLGGALGEAFTALAPVLGQVAGILTSTLSTALTSLMPVVVQIATALGGTLGQVITALVPIIVLIAQTFGQVLSALAPLIPIVFQLITPILSLIAPLLQLIGPILTPLVQLFTALLTPILALIQPLIGLLVPVLKVVATVLSTVIGWVVQAITWFVGLITGSRQVYAGISAVWNNVMSFFGTVFGFIGQVFTTGWNNAVSVVTGFGQTVLSFFTGFWSDVTGFFSGGIADIVGFFTGLPGQVVGALSGLAGSLWDIGQDMIQGLINGAGSLLRNIGNFFLDIVPDWILGPFKGALGIASPSKVFAGLGGNIVQGLMVGVADEKPGLDSQMRSLVDVPARVAQSAGYSPAASSSSRPIYTDDGRLLGWIRQIANGEARLVWAESSEDAAQDIENGELVF